MKPNTTQIINAYVRAQQQLMRQRADIKKADRPNQEASAFKFPLIDKTNVNQLNQLTHGAN